MILRNKSLWGVCIALALDLLAMLVWFAYLVQSRIGVNQPEWSYFAAMLFGIAVTVGWISMNSYERRWI